MNKRFNDATMSPFHKFFFAMVIVADLCAIACFVIFYGPWDGFRDWAISASVNTTEHSYLAYTFYDVEQINETFSKYQYELKEKASDESLINFEPVDISEGYSTIYDQQILEHEEGQDFKVIESQEENFKYWVTVIYDSTRMHLGMAVRPNGNRIRDMAEFYDAKVAVNGGQFSRNWDTLAIYPDSSIIIDGEAFYDSGHAEYLIGMNKNGVLCLYYMTVTEALEKGMDWAITFSPYLIVNGVKTDLSGWGDVRANRTAIGQRSDGIIVIITTDGRTAESPGATLPELQDLFIRYNCVNAANLDGGGSTTLVVNGEVLNNAMGGGSYASERYVYNCIYFK